MDSLKEFLHNFTRNLARASVTTLIEQFELFEGLTQRDQAEIFAAAGLLFRPAPDALRGPVPPPTKGMPALKQIVKTLTRKITRVAVTTMIEEGELWEGLDEEAIGQMFSAVGLLPPAPDALEGSFEAYELYIQTLVSRTLDTLEPTVWMNDNRFRMRFLALQAAEHGEQAERVNGHWWRRVCEYRRILILRRAEAVQREANTGRLVTRYWNDAAKLMMTEHVRVMRTAERDIRTHLRAMRRAEEILLSKTRAVRALVEEAGQHPERVWVAGAEPLPGVEANGQAVGGNQLGDGVEAGVVEDGGRAA
jgi:hypothetical protein